MADNNQVNVKLDLSSNGSVEKTTDSVKNLRKEIDGAVSASKLLQQAGSARSGGSATLNKAKEAAITPEEQMSYGVSRSFAGTGAAGRDFAKQAQGLGGIVHLYATFAANIFAVGAAFEALNKAAQFERLARASDMLGNKLGSNINAISKNIQELTGHAISMQEAMQFTNMATAAGLAGKQIEALTRIAKGAAAALGRDTGDSIRRIITGTAKQEQEILDELGIFVKAKDAYAAYAKEFDIKGGADALTAQQKVIAYADAVEKAGKKWESFATLDDPFSRFTATGKEALTELLNAVNAVFIPLLNFLAESGDAIKGIIVLITGYLARRALPEAKDLLINFFTFDKRRAEALANEAKQVIINDYIATTKQLEILKKEREAILRPDPTAATAIALGPDIYRRGKDGNEGLALKTVATSIFGKNLAADLAKFKEAKDVEESITKAINSQVKGRVEQQKLLDALIAKNIVAKNSTLQDIQLGSRGKEIAKDLYGTIVQSNTALQQQVAIEKQLLVLAKEEEAIKKRLASANVTIATDSKTGQQNFVSTNKQSGGEAKTLVSTAGASALLNTANQNLAQTNVVLAESNVKAAKGMEAFRAGAALNSNALEALRTNADATAMGSLKNLTTSVKLAGASMIVAGTQATGFGKVLAVAGAGFSGLRLGVAALATSLGALFGPLTILYTLWQLFGDTIKEWLGITSDETRRHEARIAALNELNKSTAAAAEAMKALNAANLAEGASSQQVLEVNNREISVLNNLISATQEYLNKRNEVAAQKAQETVKAAKKDGYSAEAEALRAAAASTLASKQEREEAEKLATTLEKLADVRTKVERGPKGALVTIGAARTIQLQKEAEAENNYATAVAHTLPFLKDLQQRQNQIASQTNAMVTAVKDTEDAFNDLSKTKLNENLKDLGVTNRNLQRVFEGVNGVVNASLTTDQQKAAQITETISLLEQLKKNSGDPTGTISPLLDGLAAGAGDAEVLAIMMGRVAAFAQQEPNGALVEILKLMQDRDSAKKGRIQPFSMEDLALLERMKKGIKGIEVSLARLSGTGQIAESVNALTNAMRGYASNSEIAAKGTNELAIAQETYNKSIAEAELKFKEVSLRKDTQGRDRQQLITEAKATLEATKQIASVTRDNAVAQATLTQSIAEGTAGLTAQQQVSEQIRADVEARIAMQQAGNALYAAETESLNSLGLLSQQEVARREYSVALTQTENEEKSKTLEIADKYNAKLAQIKVTEDALIRANLLSADAQESIAQERAKALKIYEREAATLKKINADEKTKLALEKSSKLAIADQNKQLEKQAKLMEKLESFADALAAAFGDFGEGLGKFIVEQKRTANALTDIDKTYAKEKQKILEETDTNTLDRLDKLTTLEQEYNEKKTATTLDGYASEAGALKSMFGEKTMAYKALAAFEKAMHIAKIAMMIKEVALDTAATGTMVANSAAAATASGAAAITNQGKGDPYSAFARMAVMAGIVAAVLAMIPGGGGGSVSIPGGMSAEDRQETQGTGTEWQKVNGKMQKVETGGGVFGDADAKSNSIANSLEIIRDNTIDGLVYDNRMLKTLESIDKGINSAAKSLYTSQGIRTGSAFGTKEGTSSSGISWLFGSSTSKSIVDAGIKIQGTFADIMKGLGNLQQYEVTQTTKKSGGFLGIGGSTRTTINTQYSDLGSDISNQISDIFAAAGDAFIIAGEKLGMQATDILSKLGTVNVNQLASLRGLQGEDLEREFNAVIGSILDSAATILFKDLEKFRKFGEGMLETVTRVIDGNEKVKAALDSMGKSIAEMPFELSESLIDAAGGLENFVEQSKFFADNFLTEAERLAPIQASVSKRMSELGFASVDTRDEFKSLIQALDLTQESDRQLYQNLMDISGAFAEAYEAVSESLSAEELRTQLLDLEITKLTLLGKVSQAVQLQRDEEIRQLQRLPKDQADALIATTKLIWALEDAVDMRNSEIELLEAQGFTYAALQAKRELELNSLTDEQKTIRQLIFAAEDAAATRELEISLLEAQGKTTDALIMRRTEELKGLSDNDKALKLRIYALEDETRILDARAEQDQRVYELLGKSEQALAVTRARELAGMEEYLRAGQEYIYALEDEMSLKEKLIEARDREVEALESTIQTLDDGIKSLEEYKKSLMTGDLSTLTPEQQYEMNKSEALRLAEIASKTPVTEEEKLAQQDAISKLPAATDAWLQASKTLFASSSAYMQDYNSVLDLLDSTSLSLADQKSEAELQLEQLKESTAFLTSIDESTKTVADLLPQYLDLQARTEAARLLAAESGLVSAGATYSGITEFQYLSDTLAMPLESINEVLNNIVLQQQADAEAANLIAPPTASLEQQNQELINQIIALRAEFAEMKAQQELHNTQLIQSNYDSNILAADKIIEDNRARFEDENWTNRQNNIIV